MPIYEYRCSSCGHELEALQKLSEAPLTTCPSCSREALVKLISAAGFHLKGSGWYATDFKSSGKKPSKPADGAAADTKGDAKADTKGDSKSESAAAPSCGANCACH
jgi:putative FmdB family regulatory protein